MKESAEVQMYTKKQRLTIYKMALELLMRDMEDDRRSICGFCYYIAKAMEDYTDDRNLPWIFFSGHNPIEYPELLPYKPKRKYNEDFWFSLIKDKGGAKRVEILKKVIAEMSKKRIDL